MAAKNPTVLTEEKKQVLQKIGKVASRGHEIVTDLDSLRQAQREDVMKVTQAEGVFYYNSLPEHWYVAGGLVDALKSNRVHDFTMIPRAEVPAEVAIRSEEQLREVLARETEKADLVIFEVVMKDPFEVVMKDPFEVVKRYFQVEPEMVGVASLNLRNAREDDMIGGFRRVSGSEVPAGRGYDCGWENYDAFRLLMAELFLGLE